MNKKITNVNILAIYHNISNNFLKNYIGLSLSYAYFVIQFYKKKLLI